MTYVDGFVIVAKKSQLSEYRKIARKAGKIWMEYGALQYVETAGDDLKAFPGINSFPKLCDTKASETVLFSWIMYKNKRDRDRINKAVMNDPRLSVDEEKMKKIFQMKDMTVGGFKPIVEFTK